MKYKCVSAKVTALNTQLTMLIPRQYSLEGGNGNRYRERVLAWESGIGDRGWLCCGPCKLQLTL